MEFDIGNNLTGLGIFFLILKYILPVFVGFILVSIAVIGAYLGFKNINTSQDLKTISLILALGFLALIVLLT